MSDPTNPATPDGNTADPSTTQIDWESRPTTRTRKRYRHAERTYTPTSRNSRASRRSKTTRNAYLELGKTKGWVEFDEPAEQAPQQGTRRSSSTWQRLEAAEARLAEHDARIAAENAAAGEELFHQDLDTWAEAEGVKLSKSDHNAIFGLLMQAPDPTQESAARQIFDAHVAQEGRP
jgi:hypothetical protein